MTNAFDLALSGASAPSTPGKAAAAPLLRTVDAHDYVSSDSLAWHGFHLEAGYRRGWDVDEMMVHGHHLTMNLAEIDLCFEMRSDQGWVAARLAPLEFCINPEGRPFSVRSMTASRYASCIIDGRYLDKLAGCHFELDAGIGIADVVVARLVQALIAMLGDQRYSPALAAEVIGSLVNAVAARHGHPAAEMKAKGGIAPSQIRALLGWLQEHLEDPLTVALMAARVGLSGAHFSREFKRSTGVTPWEYVVRMRLERARECLRDGNCLASVAAQFGFADQSHMARLFKSRFGVSPSAYVKASR